jgi:hypothetical protein
MVDDLGGCSYGEERRVRGGSCCWYVRIVEAEDERGS